MQSRNSNCFMHWCAVLMVLLVALPANAAFTDASLKGSFSVLVNRWTANSADDESAMLGVMNFNGTGNVTLAFSVMSGGVLQTGNASGTYTVNSNGTGTISFTTGFTNPVDFDILLNSSSKEIALLRTDANYPSDAVDTGTAILQSSTAVNYTLASVKGNYSIQLNKWTPDSSASQEGVIALLTFNGTGGVKGTVTIRNTSSGTATSSVTGTYTMSSDGVGSLTLGGDTTHSVLFALNTATATAPAKGAQLLQAGENASSNQVHTGVAVKQ